VPSGYSIVVMH